ncbi:hypothetical protein EVAR_40832_1 [Eumeta japonica]|uniref:Uncharacterized protein n=1 Tax=Eumeta variegata TaxID=151549 RepID=A0A4C1WHF4_EUMVA|nr:hypothetical protein EVAR_40832_1 [Eumeta japonica]
MVSRSRGAHVLVWEQSGLEDQRPDYYSETRPVAMSKLKTGPRAESRVVVEIERCSGIRIKSETGIGIRHSTGIKLESRNEFGIVSNTDQYSNKFYVLGDIILLLYGVGYIVVFIIETKSIIPLGLLSVAHFPSTPFFLSEPNEIKPFAALGQFKFIAIRP